MKRAGIRAVVRRALKGAALVAAVAACDDGGAEGSGGGGECVSDLEFFQKEISLSFMESDCATCHNPQGLANTSSLVLASSGETNYLQANFEVLKEVASYQKNGKSVLLLKPTAGVDHVGGQRFDEGDPRYKALAELVRRFDNPVVCEETGDDKTLLQKVDLIDLAATLRKVKIQLLGELPTPEELEKVATLGEGALDELLAEYMAQDAFYGTLTRWNNDKFLTDKYLGGNEATDLLDENRYPDRRWYDQTDGETEAGQLARRWSNRSVAREALELINYVVRNDRPYTEILTADYTLVNPFSAKVYGATVQFDDALDPTEFREARIDGIPHAGILTSPMFLNRYPTTPTNRNRHRARMVYRFFMATDILQKADRPVDPTTIRDHNPTMNNEQCTICHASIDPMAGAFQNWDDQGRYRVPETGWFDDMRPPGFGESDVPPDDWESSLAWLAQEIASDERFALSAVHDMYTGLVGRPPVTNPTDQADPQFDAKLAYYNLEQDFLRRATDAFIASGYNLKTVVPTIVKSPFYRADTANEALTEEEAAALTSLGTARLLTPEELDQKLTAVMGQPWQYRQQDRNQLLSSQEYRFFYGGIDSDNITSRITEPNGMMANIQLRMANEMACFTVAKDFTRPVEARKLFPHVEMNFTPEDDNGFPIPQAEEMIRRNIRYLHHRILGEVLTPGHSQEEESFQLFLAAWREGYQEIANDQASRDLHGACRATFDFDTQEELPGEARIERDPKYTVRAWMAVVTYLLADWRFTHHQ